jgi:membrane-associated phospholipid phosphatase
MRIYEWLSVLFFSLFIALAWLRPVTGRRRRNATLIGAVGIALSLLAPFAQRALFFFLPFARDLLPAPLMVLAYWQTGCLFGPSNERLQTSLETVDRKLFGTVLGYCHEQLAHNWIMSYLELAYLFCYLMIPLGVGLLYLMKMPLSVQQYWSVVLPASYLCYASTAFFQTMPPRLSLRDPHYGLRPNKIRVLNLFIVKTASIRLNTFPSAHVAVSVAAGLVLLRLAPLAGIIYLWLSLSIAVGAVVGRYHYALDAFTGAALAATIFLLMTIYYR